MFLGVQILLRRQFYEVKLSGRFWPNAKVYSAECLPQNLATLKVIIQHMLFLSK
jgi:hypothetical protein